ncbi:MAG: 2-vinyl bacteriochlorophyllide hydratase [Pseudomonadota bacterium]
MPNRIPPDPSASTEHASRRAAVLACSDSNSVDAAPGARSAHSNTPGRAASRAARAPLYTPEQRAKRDATGWTLVQGILAPLQFVVFLISLALVLRYLATGEGFGVATGSVILKTLVLYLIMITGAIWEKVVFGRYLFAPAFFWEDVFSMLVLALHTAYLIAVFTGALGAQSQMVLALAAYAAYAINAAQFVWKLRLARLDAAGPVTTTHASTLSLETAP